ncbi:hypothetical protein CHH83_26480 [Bacillus sp. 7586-K]|nr:hypothetical protein CHH83_26480 [Bacillus sp. 7586-K]
MGMRSIKGSILTVLFLLEIDALVAFSYWGYQINAGGAVKIIMAVATPLVIAILWGVFLAPKASLPIISYPVRTALKLVVFVVASAALYTTGRIMLGALFLILSLLIVAAVFILKLYDVKI